MIERQTVRILLFLLLSVSLFSGWLRAAPYREKLSGVAFPDEIGAFKRGLETNYEAEPGQGGVAIPYQAPGIE